jgi:hypothetical protein
MPEESGGLNPMGAILGGVLNIGASLLTNAARKRAAKRYFAERGVYKPSQYVQDNQTLAKNALNARSAGAVSAENNINRSATNTLSNVARASTSGSQLLAAAGGVQQQQAKSFADLSAQEELDRERKTSAVMDANQQMAAEDRYAFEDKATALGAKYGIEGAAMQSNMNTFQDVGKGLMYAGDGIGDAIGGMFGGGYNNRTLHKIGRTTSVAHG